ncbi:hypothetical protein STIAU_1396 [Stigmatella aurantiaca DW4/3-1]|uniref:Uncharacterized protein n=1 Tax=Stigmatella aurantiaca (strain DW4/3-1) TaxID=378806 RepID=Q08VZ4_STIAD|nr:hypothetical protein STIAU_1396 [Stigmatella aurantiaca DW4/3-1]
MRSVSVAASCSTRTCTSWTPGSQRARASRTYTRASSASTALLLWCRRRERPAPKLVRQGSSPVEWGVAPSVSSTCRTFEASSSAPVPVAKSRFRSLRKGTRRFWGARLTTFSSWNGYGSAHLLQRADDDVEGRNGLFQRAPLEAGEVRHLGAAHNAKEDVEEGHELGEGGQGLADVGGLLRDVRLCAAGHREEARVSKLGGAKPGPRDARQAQLQVEELATGVPQLAQDDVDDAHHREWHRELGDEAEQLGHLLGQVRQSRGDCRRVGRRPQRVRYRLHDFDEGEHRADDVEEGRERRERRLDGLQELVVLQGGAAGQGERGCLGQRGDVDADGQWHAGLRAAQQWGAPHGQRW